MKSDPFIDGPAKPSEQKSSPQAKSTFIKPQGKEKISTPVKAERMEDKLAELKRKFGK